MEDEIKRARQSKSITWQTLPRRQNVSQSKSSYAQQQQQQPPSQAQ
eukprot:CAMPEP_0202698084 /NCGR_PEP_ID=MMETSP1385-20130828/11354_1 /ASSEMBLY_ACC=CAM_ASM_000861 /TAXON_ID=933848 /ORGANISM="Elphidium margaritaceum" /LENGTH=45 /DNA_ID= /DNA_START= /DNA_END= /DNA_ORIENTATION=